MRQERDFLACETFITEDAIHDSALGIYPLWSWGVKIAKLVFTVQLELSSRQLNAQDLKEEL